MQHTVTLEAHESVSKGSRCLLLIGSNSATCTVAHMHSRPHSGTHAQSYTQWYTCTVVHTVVHMHSRTHAQSYTQSYTCTSVVVCVCVCQVGCVGAIRTSCLCPRTIYAQVFYTGKGGMHKLHACQTSTLVLDIYLCVHHHH